MVSGGMQRPMIWIVQRIDLGTGHPSAETQPWVCTNEETLTSLLPIGSVIVDYNPWRTALLRSNFTQWEPGQTWYSKAVTCGAIYRIDVLPKGDL